MKKNVLFATLLSAVLLLTACSSDTEKSGSSSSSSRSIGEVSSESSSESSETIDSSDSSTEEEKSSQQSESEESSQSQPEDVVPDIPVTDASEFEYEYDSELGGIMITKYIGSSDAVNFPPEIDGKKVMAIGDFSF